MAAPPTLTHTGERLYESVAPLATEDAEHGYALAHFVSALAALFDEAADVSRDGEDGTPGYAQLFDPDTAPEAWLPYAAQFVGVTLSDRLPEASKRVRLRETDGFRRGTPDAILGAARQHLTGLGRAFLVERQGSAYRLSVTTFTDETPDADLVRAALRPLIPAGIVWTLVVVTGTDFDSLTGTHTDFDDVTTTFSSFDDLRSDPTRT